MIGGVDFKRNQIASLITSDLRKKREQKKRETAADLLKERMKIAGSKDVAELQQGGAMEREKLSQGGATYRQNIAIAGDKAVQAMKGTQAANVQSIATAGSLAKQNIMGKQAADLLTQTTDIEDSRISKLLATIPSMDEGDFKYDLTGTEEEEKKKKDLTNTHLAFPTP